MDSGHVHADEENAPSGDRSEPPPSGEASVSDPPKLLRIGLMTRELLAEARRAPLDAEGRVRLKEIYERSIRELQEILSAELREELGDLAVPFDEAEEPTDAELRIAQAQIVGWLEGLFHGIQASLWAQRMAYQVQAAQTPGRTLQEGDSPGRYL